VSAPRRRKAPTRPSARRRQGGSGSDFWGSSSTADPAETIRMSDDPAAMVRSLGPPPLPGHEQAAEAYFAVVYDKAAALAAALAAASNLLQTDESEDAELPAGKVDRHA
jgi:hypothetical protein